MDSSYTLPQIQSGMVAIVGPPNAGKSTLMNQLLGMKVSIVTPKPQTTRNRILGVLNGDSYQIVLIDTPGLHKADQPLNKEMMRLAMESLTEVDAILFLLDVCGAAKKKNSGNIPKEYLERINAPAFLLLNKIDLIAKQDLLPVIERYQKLFPFEAILPLSAKTGAGTDEVVTEILKKLPLGPRYFPEDVPTDVSERFLVGEIIREKVFLLTGQEVPYSTAVVIDSFVEGSRQITIHASIVLEKASQKGIVIGKGGHKLKSIGTAARRDMEKMLGEKVLLKLWVKVKKNWSQNSGFLKEIGF
ncbi:MAG: GTPase Era [Desulfopila sp.]|jgi:GTP-binding protein Era|nr:GTPase Era [Desulfopila sp.]